MSNATKISPPWVTYAKEVQEIFLPDPDVVTEYDGDENKLTLMVEGGDKASAIDKILPDEVEFGNVKLIIEVKPSNDESVESTIRKAFAGNPAVSSIQTIDGSVPMFGGRTYVLFVPEVVQFFDDDMSDLHGLRSTLYQDIAREVFNAGPSVSFCTEMAE